jgi:hypothetical protein
LKVSFKEVQKQDRVMKSAYAQESPTGEAIHRVTRHEMKSARKERDAALDVLAKVMSFKVELLATVRALEPPKLEPMMSPTVGSDITAVSLLGDWHFGEVVKSSEVEELNEYSAEIADERLRSLARKVKHWIKTEAGGHKIGKIQVVTLGDLINGFIHQEYLWGSDLTPPKQVARAAAALARYVQELSTLGIPIEVDHMACDNHSRTTIRLPYKKQGEMSLGLLVGEIAEILLRQTPNVKFRQRLGIREEILLGTMPTLIEHGNNIKTWMGIPFYGLDRLAGLEARKRLRAGKPFGLHILAHWHVPVWGPSGLINGCLIGTTEYDHAAGRYARPSQTTFLLHPRFGVYNYVPWDLSGGLR